MRLFVLTVALTLTVAHVKAQSPHAAAASQAQITRQTAFNDKRINESSGLAMSRRFPGFLWTHNDSGDSARVFLLDKTGATRIVVHLQGSGALDWEDMALTGSNNKTYLYIGDIGDNRRERKEIHIYRFPESLVVAPMQRNSSTKQRLQAEKMTLRYPDGARDAETLIVTSRGEIVIVEKTAGASRLYKTTRSFENGITQTLALIGRFQFAGENIYSYLTTGGDLNAREDRVLVRTYSHAYEWKLSYKAGAADWRGLWNAQPRRFALPTTQQGEAICYDGTSWVANSEGVNAPLQWLSPD